MENHANRLYISYLCSGSAAYFYRIAALIAALSFVMKDADITGGTRTNNEKLSK
jgi:hypothetical protein